MKVDTMTKDCMQKLDSWSQGAEARVSAQCGEFEGKCRPAFEGIMADVNAPKEFITTVERRILETGAAGGAGTGRGHWSRILIVQQVEP